MRTTFFTRLLILVLFITECAYSQTWSSGKPILHPVRGGNIASFSDQTDGYFFIISGRDESQVIKTVQRYTASTNTWDTLAPHPTGLLGGATTVLNHHIYVIGGVINPPGFGQDTVYRLDLTSNKWSLAAPFPYEIVDAKAVAYGDSLIYVAGGLGGADSANVLVYNAHQNKWKKVSPIPSSTGLNFGGFTRAGNQLIYMCGTDGFGSSNYFNTVYVGTIDPSNYEVIHWTKGADFPGKTRSFFDALPWMNNTVIMTGGSTNNAFDTWSDECFVFNPVQNKWTQLPNKPTAWLTGQSGSVKLKDNSWELICAGGFDSVYIHTTELLKQTETPTAIDKNVSAETVHLAQNTPNPFTDHTIIQYSLNTDGAPMTLCIYDVLGNLVETLVDEKQKNGAYAINYQSNLRSGVYYCKLISGDHYQVIKMVCAR